MFKYLEVLFTQKGGVMKKAFWFGLAMGAIATFIAVVGQVLGFLVGAHVGCLLDGTFFAGSIGFTFPFFVIHPRARELGRNLGSDPAAGIRVLLMLGTGIALYVGSLALLYYYNIYPATTTVTLVEGVAIMGLAVFIGVIVSSAVIYLVFAPKWEKEWEALEKRRDFLH